MGTWVANGQAAKFLLHVAFGDRQIFYYTWRLTWQQDVWWIWICICDSRTSHMQRPLYADDRKDTTELQTTWQKYDSFAMAVIENDTINIIGRVPWTISLLCDLFLKNGSTIVCVITGPWLCSRDLENDGLNVPCKLVFSAPVKIGSTSALHLPSLVPRMRWNYSAYDSMLSSPDSKMPNWFMSQSKSRKLEMIMVCLVLLLLQP